MATIYDLIAFLNPSYKLQIQHTFTDNWNWISTVDLFFLYFMV